MSGRLQNLQLVMTEAYHFVGLEISAHGRILSFQRNADHSQELSGNVVDQETVFLCNLRFQSVGMIDGVYAEVMVEVSVCTEQVYGFQSLVVYVLGDGRTLFFVVGTAVYDYTFLRVVAYYIGILL